MKKTAFSWLSLGIACLTGLAGWLLFNYWQAGTPVDALEFDAMNRQTELNTQVIQETLSEKLTDRTASAEHERLESPIGLALFRNCAEWTDFNENHPSENASENKQRACLEFRQYIETGALPD